MVCIVCRSSLLLVAIVSSTAHAQQQGGTPFVDRQALGNMADGSMPASPTARSRVNVEISAKHAQIADIYLGTPPQRLRCLLDSGSSDLWVPSKRCRRCQNPNAFDADSSSTFRPQMEHTMYGQRPRAVKISYGSGTVVGYAVSDTLQFGSLNIPNQAFLIVEDAALPPGRQWDGICGLGWKGIAQVIPTLYQNVQAEGKHALFSIVPQGNAAQLVLGQLPQAQLTWVPAEVYDPSGATSGVERTFWMVSGGLRVNAPTPYPARFLVDTGTNQVLLVPKRHYQMFIRSLIPAQLFNNMCGMDRSVGVFCDCSIQQYQGINPLRIVISGQDFVLPLSRMFMTAQASSGNQLCLLTIQPNDLAGGGSSLPLGDLLGGLLGSIFGPGVNQKVVPSKSGELPWLPDAPFQKAMNLRSEHKSLILDETKFTGGVKCQDRMVIERGQVSHTEGNCATAPLPRRLQLGGLLSHLHRLVGGGRQSGNGYNSPMGRPQPASDPQEYWMIGGFFLENFVTVFDFDNARLGFAQPPGSYYSRLDDERFKIPLPPAVETSAVVGILDSRRWSLLALGVLASVAVALLAVTSLRRAARPYPSMPATEEAAPLADLGAPAVPTRT